jgi:CRISPR-associated protein Cmr3
VFYGEVLEVHDMLAKFKLLQPMLFRSAGEFDPSSRGVYSRATSFILPTPSTIAGVLATIFGSNFNETGDWLCEYKNALGNLSLRGPFIKIIKKDEQRQQTYLDFSFKGRLISYEFLKEYVTIVKKIIEEKNYRTKEKLLKYLSELMNNKDKFFKPKKQERIGIGLKVRRENGDKVVDEGKGLIYSAEYVDYMFDDNLIAEIYYDIVGIGNIKKGHYQIKLGGEGRISQLIVEDGDIGNIIKIENEGDVLYVVSPMLYETGKDIKSMIKNEINKKVREIYGKVDLFGAGFSLLNERRKPIYQALVPGSLIFLEENINGQDIYKKGLGYGKEIGYGTILAISV